MYPNTIEVSDYRKPNSSPTFSIPKLITIIGFIIVLFAITTTQLLANNEINRTTINETKMLADQDMNLLRISLQKSLLRDGLINEKTEEVNIIFNNDFMTVNGQNLSFDKMHIYNSILNAFGVDPGSRRQIILKDEMIMIGYHRNDEFVLESVSGRLALEL